MNPDAQIVDWAARVAGRRDRGGRDGCGSLFTRAFAWAPLVLMACAVILGGGVWNIGDVVLSLIGMLVLAWAWIGQAFGHLPRWRAVEWLTVAGFALLAVIHWVPLPSHLWATLPGRAKIASELAVAGVEVPWRWLSLDTSGAFRSLAALIPGMAMLVSVRGVPDPIGAKLGRWLVGLACLSVLLGVAQIAGGAESPLRLHDFHNRSGALGFFAYRNLQATHLLMALPVAVALLMDAYSPARASHLSFGHTLIVLAVPLLLLGVALTLSRAGLILGMLALGGCIALYWTWPGRQRRWVAVLPLLAAVAVGIVLIALFALPRLLDRIGENPLDDGRWPLHAAVREVARTLQPVGAGLGSFEQVFQAAPPNVALPGAYMNHAHNEWLQIWLELGWLSVPLVLAALALLGRGAWRVWRNPNLGDMPSRILFARAASISLIIALVHSYFDYPLRTGTNLVIFFLMAGLLVRGAFNGESTTPGRERAATTIKTPGAETA